MRTASRWLSVALSVAPLSAARGGDPPSPAGEPPASVAIAVAEVLGAVASNDEPALGRLAGRAEPDPWLVADGLLEAGRADAARRFAEAAPEGPARAALLAHLRTLRESPEARAVLEAARAALRAGRAAADPAGVLAATDGIDRPPLTVPGLEATLERGRALERQGRRDLAADLLAAAAGKAESAGWTRGAAEASLQAGRWAHRSARARSAVGLLRRAVATAERTPSADLLGRALEALGEFESFAGYRGDALETYRRLARTGRTADRPDALAAALEGEGAVLALEGRVREGIDRCLEACAIRRSRKDARALVRCLSKTAALLSVAGRDDEALSLLEEAERAQGGLEDEALRSEVLLRRGSVHARAGRLADARGAFEAMLRLHDACGGCDNRANALLALGGVDFEDGDAEALGRHVGEAREILGRLPPSLDVVESWETLVLLQRRTGDADRAVETQRTALAVAESLGEPIAVMGALEGLSDALYGAGRVAEETRTLERLLALAEATGAPDRLCRTLLELARKRAGSADTAGAIDYASRAAALARENGLLWEEARAESTASMALSEAGQNRAALAAQERAHEIVGRMGHPRLVVESLLDLALRRRSLGEFGEADELVERALALLAEAPSALNTARALNLRAGLRLTATGEAAEGLPFAQRALEVLPPEAAPWFRAGILTNLASMEMRTGLAPSAVGHLREAAVLTERTRTGLSDRESFEHRADWSHVWLHGTQAAFEAGDPEALAWFLEGGRAAMLREALGKGGDLAGVALPAALREQESAARLRYRQALDEQKATAESARFDERKAAEAAVERALRALEEAIGRIQREARSGSDLVFVEPDALSRIQAGLRAEDALLLYLLDDDVGSSFYRGLCLVVRRASARMVRLVRSRMLNSACAAVLCGAEEVDPRKVPFLRSVLADPLGLEDDVRRVLVSPSGSLGYVPLALLFPGRDVAFVPSGTTLRVLRERSGGLGKGVLGAGAPVYEPGPPLDAAVASRRGGDPRRRLDPLPHTAPEVRAVADVAMLGREATVPRLVETLASRTRWRALHLACHGLIDPAHPLLSSLALTPTSGHDGFLTALDVMALDVPADLVVLSACETARGTQFAAEGVVGLMRAFMHAGAQGVVCSQWPVDDAATAALMTRFYALWNPKDGGEAVSAAEALRRAQEWVAAQPQWSHPRYWAAWVLWGLPD